jgi:hypothetical protein
MLQFYLYSEKDYLSRLMSGVSVEQFMMIHEKYEHTREFEGNELSFERYSQIVSKWTLWKDENYFKRKMTLKPRTSLSFFYQSVSSETKQHCIYLYEFIKDKPNDILWTQQGQKKSFPIQRDCSFYGKIDSYCTIMSKLIQLKPQNELVSASVSHFYEVFEFEDKNRPYELTYEYRNIINLYEVYFPEQPKLEETVLINTFQQIMIHLVTTMYERIKVDKTKHEKEVLEKERIRKIIERQVKEKEKRDEKEKKLLQKILVEYRMSQLRNRGVNSNKKGIKPKRWSKRIIKRKK